MYQDPRSQFLQLTYPDTVLKATIMSFHSDSLAGEPGGEELITTEPRVPNPLENFVASDSVSNVKRFDIVKYVKLLTKDSAVNLFSLACLKYEDLRFVSQSVAVVVKES